MDIFIIEKWKDAPEYIYIRENDGSIITTSSLENINWEGRYIRTRNKIIKNEDELGEVHLIMTTEYLENDLIDILISKIIEIIVVDIIIVVLIFSLIRFKILQPIERLRKATSEIAKGKLKTKINIKSKDEIGNLSSAFMKMTSDLRKSRSELEKHSHDLEKQVKKRTREMESKIDELERFNKFSVGRELKMVELKRRIKELGGKRKRHEAGGEKT